MADFLVGLDFGTSQTKVCLLNKSSNLREFLEFENGEYFLPSLIVKRRDNTFAYGDETAIGIKYRFFKMAAAEDEDLIQVTNEDLNGNLPSGILEDFRKYSSGLDIKPEILVILYLTYVHLFVKKSKESQGEIQVGGLLGRLVESNNVKENTYSINLGIPTDWNNPEHIKRKIKFQCLLLFAIDLSNEYKSLEEYTSDNERMLIDKIYTINSKYLKLVGNKSLFEGAELFKSILLNKRLSVFPESAAGINYLLKTKRLANGVYASLDIGAGTTDIAIFQVNNDLLTFYYCSESVEIASNDLYSEYAKLYYKRSDISANDIKLIEKLIRGREEAKLEKDQIYIESVRSVKGCVNDKGIEYAILKIVHKATKHLEKVQQVAIKNSFNEKPIIVFGGGSSLNGFSEGKYHYYYYDYDGVGKHDRFFIARPITDYVSQFEISGGGDEKIQRNVNLLILALGLTYCKQDGNYIPFSLPKQNLYHTTLPARKEYFFYDLDYNTFK